MSSADEDFQKRSRYNSAAKGYNKGVSMDSGLDVKGELSVEHLALYRE